MEEKLSKATVLQTLPTERVRWEELLAQVSDARMTVQMGSGRLSLKDIIALVAWHEQQTVELLQPDSGHLPARDWLWAEREDKRDEILFTEFRDQPLAAVRAREQESYQHLLAAIESTSEADVRGAQDFLGMTSTWQPWNLIAAHSYERYRHHEPAIRAWLGTL